MKPFKRIYLEITNICNLACSFCPKTLRKPQYMSIDNFNKILQELQPYSEYLYFHVKGEPLLHPELATFLDISNQMEYKVNITTNGTMLHNKKDILINAPSLRQLNISLHSFDANNNINFDDYISDVINFTKEALDKSNIIIALRLWNLDKENIHEEQRRRNINILRRLEEEFNLDYEISSILSEKRGLKLRHNLYLNQDYEFAWPDLNADFISDNGFCYGLRNQIAILVDGTVVPCCLDGEGVISLGNILHTPFENIINSPRAIAIKEGFSNRKTVEEMCKRCGYIERFTKN